MEDINRIKVVLAEKKRTNVWLANQIGMNPATVSKWCTYSSQPELPTLKEVTKPHVIMPISAISLTRKYLLGNLMFVKSLSLTRRLTQRKLKKTRNFLKNMPKEGLYTLPDVSLSNSESNISYISMEQNIDINPPKVFISYTYDTQ